MRSMRRSASLSSSAGRTPTRAAMPSSIAPSTRSPTRTSARVTRWMRAIMTSVLWHLRPRLLKIRSRLRATRRRIMGSRMRTGVLSIALVVGALASFTLHAQDAGPKADPVHGKAISYTCLGCHRVPGYKNAYPNYSVPELRGQHPEYLVSALKEYKSGERSHFTMHSQAEELSEQDMA